MSVEAGLEVLYGSVDWSFRFRFLLILSASVVGGLGFEFYVFNCSFVGWRHALRGEWPYWCCDN